MLLGVSLFISSYEPTLRDLKRRIEDFRTQFPGSSVNIIANIDDVIIYFIVRNRHTGELLRLFHDWEGSTGWTFSKCQYTLFGKSLQGGQSDLYQILRWIMASVSSRRRSVLGLPSLLRSPR